MIEVLNLSKYFGSLAAVKDASFKVSQGEIMGFLGPNGAGKTTTMRILAGFFPPSSGRVKVAGYDVVTRSLEVRKLVGYFPERAPLYPEMTVSSYLQFSAEVKGVERKRRKMAISEAMERCGLEEVKGKLIGKLSKGYRQRVCLAQAIVGDPPILILDEPTIGLDPEQVSETRRLIREWGGKKTIILSTHILPEVELTCHKVLIIHEGRIVASDTPENLTKQVSSAIRLSIEISAPPQEVLEKLGTLPGILKVEKKGFVSPNTFSYLVEAKRDIRQDISELALKESWVLLELQRLSLSLEEIFLKLVR